MKRIFAVMFAMLFAASTSVFAAKHMEAEKGAKSDPHPAYAADEIPRSQAPRSLWRLALLALAACPIPLRHDAVN